MNSYDQHYTNDYQVQVHEQVVRLGDVQTQSDLGELIRRMLRDWLVFVRLHECHHHVQEIRYRSHEQKGHYLKNQSTSL